MQGLIKGLTVGFLFLSIFTSLNAAAQDSKNFRKGKKVVVIIFGETQGVGQKKEDGRFPSSVQTEEELQAAARIQARASSIASQEIPDEKM